MKLIESNVEYITQEEGLEGIYKAIELAGRTAYHSQDKITPDSAKDFVDRMIKSKHGAALEHGTVYLFIPYEVNQKLSWIVSKYLENTYSHVCCVCNKNAQGDYTITTNYRVLVENNWLDDLQYLCSPTEFHEKRYTMKFTCSRAIAQELTRHRTFSFLMESQRYINYSKEKHGGEITFIEPSWLKEISYDIEEKFIESFSQAEDNYMWLLQWLQPQQARDVLPNATKTEISMTGFASDWKRLLRLRLFEETGKVHLDMKVLMEKLKAECIKNEIWNDIINSDCKEV